MATELRYRRFHRLRLSEAERRELVDVDRLAQDLLRHLQEAASKIDAVHVHRAQSQAVQGVVAELLTDKLAFRQEVVLTPEIGLVTRARPDFFYRLSDGRGILAEVERGGTTTNNHDLKDFWKCHMAPDAHHLFLVVPMSNWREDGRSRERPFGLVAHRLAAFFGDPRREVDVVSAHVFGYGRPE